jgi:putative transposase
LYENKEDTMPVPKKRTISTSEAAKVESSSDQKMPAEQEFRQRMRNLAVSAMRVLIEEVMRGELEQCLCAEWGEITPERKGYRNGSYTRDLVTKTGRIEDISVPRDREGVFHSQAFERYSRYEPEVAEALTEMFVSGTSTHKVGKVAETLMGVAPSASAVSRLNQTLTQQFKGQLPPQGRKQGNFYSPHRFFNSFLHSLVRV